LQPQNSTSFDLNGLKNGTRKNFENSLKSMQTFQILMGGMNFRKRSQKNQISSAVRSDYACMADYVIWAWFEFFITT
jgi:hypothetical protein